MKYLIVLLLLIDPIKQLTKVAKVNAAKKAAQQAYMAHDYKKAIKNYMVLLDSLEVEDDVVLLNLANAYHKMKDSANARISYEVLTSSENKKVQSIAQQQLGVIQFKTKKYETALTYFKRALRANPNNSNARYNYELTKKIIDKKKEEEEKKDKDKDKDKKEKEKDNKKKDEQKKKENQQKKDKEKKGQEEKDKKKGDKKEGEKQDKGDKKEKEKQKKEKGEGEKKDKKEKKKGEKSDEKEKNEKEKMSQQTKENLEKIKISPQKAKMILEAMKNQEVQYLQQAKKRSKRKEKDNTKPDW